MENMEHFEAYQRALKDGANLTLRCLKFLFFGPPRSGKTVVRRRLLREIVNLSQLNEPSVSTGVAETNDVIIRKLTSETAAIAGSQWWSMKRSKEGTKLDMYSEGDLGYLAQLFYQLIYKSTTLSTISEQVLLQPHIIEHAKMASSSVDVQDDDILASTLPYHKSPEVNQMEINNAFEKLTNILQSDSPVELKQLLEEITMINMMEVGGVPAFLDMLPALTTGPALYLLFFRLDQELHKHYPVRYLPADSKDEITLESSYSIEEVLFQSLASIACFSRHSHAIPASQPSLALLCGTYEDRVSVAQIFQIDRILQEKLMRTRLYEGGLLLKSSKGKMMFTVDNIFGTEESEMSYIREDIERIIKAFFPAIPIPASWLMFRIVLHLLNKPVVSLAQCEEIAKRLSMHTPVQEAIWFFHHNIGSLMHYPDIPSMEGIVICGPQVLFDSISSLIIDKFKHGNRALRPHEIDEFHQKGQFTLSHIQDNLRSSYLELKQLMDILKYHNIVSEIKHDQEENFSQSEPKFIMPAILKSASDKELDIPVTTSPADQATAPIMIHFEGGFVPFGVFSTSIAHLIALHDSMSPKWQLCDDLKRNKITFCIDGTFYATITSRLQYLKIVVSHHPRARSKCSLSKICSAVRQTVVGTLETVISKMRYKPYAMIETPLFSSIEQPFDLAFTCCLEDSHTDHLMKVVEADGKLYAKCLKTAIALNLVDEHLIWFIANTSAGDTLLTEGDLRILKIVLGKHLPINLTRPPVTKMEVIKHLQQIDQYTFADILSKNQGVKRLQDHVFNNIYKKALQDEKHTVRLQAFRMVLCGIPRSGKTTFWKRLAIENFVPSKTSPSTSCVESQFLSAQKKKNDEEPHVQTEMLFDLHLYREAADLDREALTIYKHIIETHAKSSKSAKKGAASTIHKQHSTKPDQVEDATAKNEISQSANSQENQSETRAAVKQQPNTQSEVPSSAPVIMDPIVAEIDKCFKELNGLLKRGEKLPEVLDIKKLCHLQDIGGQKAFSQLLPTVSTGKALYLLFFNYKDFGISNSETVQRKDSPEEVPTGAVYEQIDVIMQSLICVSTIPNKSTDSTTTKSSDTTQTKSSDNVALLVGTHVDELQSEDDISHVNKIIYEKVKPFINSDILVYAEEEMSSNIAKSGDKEEEEEKQERLVLKVAIDDNKWCSHQPEDYKKVIMHVVNEKFGFGETDKLPASWYMFSVILRRIQHAGYSVLQYNHCLRIASKLHIRQFRLQILLSRLHKVLGIVLYFPEVPGLEDIVICDPAFIYRNISELIFKSFDDRTNATLSNKLKKWGIFTYEELKEHYKIRKEGIKLNKLIILLQHLGVIAPVQISSPKVEPEQKNDTKHSDASHSGSNPACMLKDDAKLSDPIHLEYLIPCVLKDAKDLGVLTQDTQACSIVPLRINFECGFAPMGGFCYLFTKLISNNKKWKLFPTDHNWANKNNIYWRNKATFEVEDNVFVTLLSTDKYYEIHIIHSKESFKLEADGHNICKRIWDAISTILDNSPNDSLQKYTTVCICTINHQKTDGHVMEFVYKPHKFESVSQVKARCKCSATVVKIEETQPSVIVWFKKPHILVKGTYGKKVHLCVKDLLFKVKDNRPSECEWRFDGEKIESDEHYKNESDKKTHKLSILHFENRFKGKYECVISTTEEPIVSTAVEVIVDCALPGKPGEPNVCHNSTTTFSWTPVPEKEQNGDITGYTVQVVGPDQSTVHDRVVSADATSTRIPDLNAFTSYTFKVSAKTKAGSGPAASILSKTPEGAPSGAVGELTVRYKSPSTATLSWTPVPKQKRNGVITGYTVQVEGPDQLTIYEQEVSADATSTKISKLNPFTLYTFKVSAKTKAGSGSAASISSKTPESAPSGSPGGLTVNYGPPTTAELSWTPLPEEKRNGVITGYTVQVVGPDQSTVDEQEVSANATSTKIPILNPFTSYTFKVRAKTKAGPGPAASKQFKTPEEAPCGSPGELTVDHRLSWTPVPEEKQNGVITGYIVQVMGPNHNSTQQISADETSIEMSKLSLSPVTEYIFTIRAKTKAGPGPAARKQFKTPEAAPSGSPGGLTVNHRLLSTAKLSWTPVPEGEQNGVITGYTVQVVGPDQSTVYEQEVSANATSTKIPNLNPFTSYTFKVSAKTKVDPGPPASITEKRCKIVESKAVLFSASLVLVAIAAAIFFHHLGEKNSLYSTVHNLFNPRKCSFQEFKQTVNLTEIKDYRVLRQSVEKIGEWQSLCENLDLDETEMSRIKNEELRPHLKKDECLKSYVNSDKGSWEEVVIAVARYPFYDKRLAKNIAEEHLQSPNLSKIMSMLDNCDTYH